VQDPETYLNQLGVELTCAVDPAQPAVIDREHRISIGYETFFVSNDEARQQLENDPSLWGWITDPVSKEMFLPTSSSPRATFEDRLYVFSDDANRTAFETMPEVYAYPAHGMLPKKEEGEAAGG
jgi:YHS domain-containing protein